MKKFLSVFFVAIAFFSGYSQPVTRLLGCSSQQTMLWVMDTSSYNIVSTLTLSALNGSVVSGVTGLARHPVTGVYYAVVKCNSSRYLATLNPATASLTNIGDLNDNFSQIAFTAGNSLWGCTGSSGNNPLSTFRINPANATTTLLSATPNSSYGEVIKYNPVDNKMYHWSGWGGTFEKFDTAAIMTTTNIGFNPIGPGELTGGVYKGNSAFIIADLNGDFYRMHSSGANVQVGTAPDANTKGLEFITCTRSLTATSNTVCAGKTVTLNMNAGGSAYQWYKNGTAVSGATLQSLVTGTMGIYRCMITDGCGSDTTAAAITLSVLTSPTVALSGVNYFCPGINNITITATGGGTSQWYKNGVLIPGATTPTYVATTAGVYNMIKTNLNGCSDSAAVGKVLATAPAPTVNISASSNTLCFGATMSMTASGAVTYSWNTGATSASVIIGPTVTTNYTVLGTNTVTGCAGTGSITIIVTSCTGLKENAMIGSHVKIFPNPSSGMVNLQSEKVITSLEIFDVTGRSVMKKDQLNTSEFSIDLGSLQGSVYYLSLRAQDGALIQARLVISK
jgi:hypothetical protein